MSGSSSDAALWRRGLRWLLNYAWGGAALISVYISIVSGLVLALHYEHSEAFYSTTTIELVAPYGFFWRGLHYFSSQFFFLLLLAHVAAILWKKKDQGYSRSAWIRLAATLPVAILLLFTGYVLRGDATGEAAGAIAEHICQSIPIGGQFLNNVFFDLTTSGLRKVYVQHLVGLVILGGVLAWPHLRRYRVRWRDHLLLLCCTVLISALISAPIEPSRFGLLFIAGPWFFLGLQELLRYLPILFAGVLIPMMPLACLFWLPRHDPGRKWGLMFICLWLAVYGGLSWLCLQRI